MYIFIVCYFSLEHLTHETDSWLIISSNSENLGTIDEMPLLKKWRQNNASNYMVIKRSFTGLQISLQVIWIDHIFI